MSFFPFPIPTVLIPPWVTLESGDWQGDTGSATLGSGTVIINAGDKNVRSNPDDLIGSSVNFDFQCLWEDIGTGSPFIGFTDNGTTTGAQLPTTTNPNFIGRNGGSNIGWAIGNGSTIEKSKSNGWMASNTIGLSRRGSTIYGLIDGSVDHTFTGTTTSAAGKFYFGASGSGAWTASATVVRYRVGAALPAL